MLLKLFRSGLTKTSLNEGNKIIAQQYAGISSKSMRGGPMKFAKPWDYCNNSYGLFQAFFDKTSWRFNENTKIIVVDGPIAAGKTAFAKVLAEELEMLHLPEATMDDSYINNYGFDLRELDPQLPPDCRSYDITNFCRNPTHKDAATLQLQMFRNRYEQYVHALCHILNTGQGVVLERSPYSDFVFMEAMVEAGFVGKHVRKYYYEVKKNVAPFLMTPHLIIYLDVPVPVVQDRIKKRNLPHEVNSKALTPAYLQSIERNYKEHFLKDMNEHCEMLVYDWSEGGEAEIVIEDVERIDFDKYTKNDKRMKDWWFVKEWDLCERRIFYTTKLEQLMLMLNVPTTDVPEIIMDPLDSKKRNDVYDAAPGGMFSHGYNTNAGDKNLLFKTFIPLRIHPEVRKAQLKRQ